MKTILDIIIVFFTFLAFHCLQLFILPCLAGAPLPQVDYSIGSHIKNVAFYLVFWAFVLFVMNGNSFQAKQSIYRFTLLILLQITVFFVKWSAVNSRIFLFFSLCEVCIPIQWVLVCKCITNNVSNKMVKRDVHLLTLFITALLILSMAIDIKMSIRMEEKKKIYFLESEQLAIKKDNLFFTFNIKNAIVESAIASSLFSFYQSWEYNEGKKLPRRFAQAIIGFGVVAVFYIGCVCFAPVNCIKTISIKNQRSIDRGELNCSTQIIKVSRFAEPNSWLEDVFCATRCVIFLGEEKITDFYVDGAFPAISTTREDSTIILEDNYTKVSYKYSTIGLFFNKAIVILSDDRLSVILVEDIPQQNENQELLFFCKQLAEKQVFSTFPYYAEYLLRWDKDFIVPVLQDYSMLSDASFKKQIEESGLQYEYVRNEAVKMLEVNSQS